MKLCLLLLFLFMFPFVHVSATHLAGGDFELQHQENYNYRLILNLYFDDINGNPFAQDYNIRVKIFEKGTNTEVTAHFMRLRSRESLNYTNVSCASGELKTSHLIYYEDIVLAPEVYTHPEGYYVVWERCCRNGTITNINLPGDAGQTFYMEFPAVTRNGQFFKNSSPVLSAPISDYACINQEFSYDFGATDPDGDKIMYDMVTPLKGYSSPLDPASNPLPAPYPEVNWLPGYGKNEQIRGNPALAIDPNTGMLTVNPSFIGLFIFSVRYQEFRNGKKIGEVRRDFQLLVKDCPTNDFPVITAMGDKGAGYKEGQVVRINPTGPRCLPLTFTDPDKNERLSLAAKPVNFSQQGFSLSGQTTGIINTAGVQETLTASICFDACFDSEGKIYLLDVIVSDFGDNGCGIPKTDTVRVSFIVEPTINQPPVMAFSSPKKVFELYDGDKLTFDAIGKDPDNDPVTVSMQGLDFDSGTQSIVFQKKSGTGQVTAPFSWQIDCKANLAPTYKLQFTTTSMACGKSVSRSEVIEVRILKRPLANNIISSDQALCYGSTPAALVGELPTGGNGSYQYVWEVSTTDAQAGFAPAPNGSRNQSYVPAALSQTSWFRRTAISGSCNELEHVSEPVKITIYLLPDLPIVENAAVCPNEKATLKAGSAAAGVIFEWYDQPINGNLLYAGSTYETVPLTNNATYYIQTVNSYGCISASRAKVEVTVLQSTADAGGDATIIHGRYAPLKAKGGLTYQWSPATDLSDPFIPNPLATPDRTTTYTVTVTSPSGCIYTDDVTITVLPRIRAADALTSNGDGINDTWYIENIEHYPRCNIQIFTRWGAKVFESDGYQTPWDGTNGGKELPMAAYYYIIKLDNKEKPIAGSLTLVK